MAAAIGIWEKAVAAARGEMKSGGSGSNLYGRPARVRRPSRCPRRLIGWLGHAATIWGAEQVSGVRTGEHGAASVRPGHAWQARREARRRAGP